MTQHSVKEIRTALLQLMKELWNEYEETGRERSLILTINSKQREAIVKVHEEFIDEWNDSRNTEIVYYVETADLEDDDFKTESRDYRLCLTKRHQDYDYPNFKFEIDDKKDEMVEGYIEVEMSDDEEDSTRKNCSVCKKDSSCGNYNEDKEWVCEECEKQ